LSSIGTHDKLSTNVDGSKKANLFSHCEIEENPLVVYALAPARRNYPQSNIRNRLLIERTNWKNHKGIHRKDAYITRTIKKARAIVENS